MRAEDLIREGNLADALLDLQEHIRNQPDNGKYRIFLFQLLAVLGQWDRALNQLNIIGDIEKDAWPLVHMYRDALHCEALREDIFSGRRKPLVLGEPPQWLALLLESLRFLEEGKFDEARTLREQAFDQAPGKSGAINGQPFAWIADADSRLGPAMELIMNGRYYWVPFEQLREFSATAPTDLRDLVWLPVELTLINGGQAFGLMPARYPGSEKAPDVSIQMARKTEWLEITEGIYQGLGQRMLTTDQQEYPLFDIRSINIG